MTPEQFDRFLKSQKEQLELSVATAIEKNVNGKIRNLDKKLDDYITVDTTWKVIDKKWKEDAQPTIDLGNNVRGFNKVLLYLLGLVASIGGVFAFIKLVK